MMKKILLTTLIISLISLIFCVNLVKAQVLSLSITPPLSEVMVKPGKSVSIKFNVGNSAANTILTANVSPFAPSDEAGNVALQKPLTEYDPGEFSSWFTFQKPDIKLGGKFPLGNGDVQEVIVKISPPETTPEGDYYFNINFETDTEGMIGVKGPASKAKIGANILLTISIDGNPRKTAKLAGFSAPKIIDSFSSLSYKVRIANVGSVFFKPIGKITVKPLFGQTKTLDLAQQNVAAASIRQLLCQEKETLYPCQIKDKVLIGVYRAKLSFNIEGQDKNFTANTTAIALPINLLIGMTIAFTIIKFITRKNKDRMNSPKSIE